MRRKAAGVAVFCVILVFVTLWFESDNMTTVFKHTQGYWRYGSWDLETSTKSSDKVAGKNIPTSGAGKSKVILAWNSFFGRKDFEAGGCGTKPFAACPVSNCFLTRDHAYLSGASALLFHAHEAAALPTHRDERQLYVFFLQESPDNSNWYLERDYNLTMTYRADSDIRIPYGEFYKKRTAESSYRLKFPFAKKTRSVAWTVSNCYTPSKRERYVRELKRYIDVDVYGHCGGMPGCPKNDRSCRQKMIPSMYKFYLAFENSRCQDYVTEKLFQALSTEIVPIVYGGTNYSRDAPPHSVINVEHYSSPKELARYLKRLAANETEYNAYFEWKKTYDIRGREAMRKGFCKLCEIVNTPSFHKIYESMTSWWSVDKCKAPIRHGSWLQKIIIEPLWYILHIPI